MYRRNVIRTLKERWQVMSVDQKVALNLDDLSVDVFELADHQGLVVVESLTAGHGTIKVGASCDNCSCCCCCCFPNNDELVTATTC